MVSNKDGGARATKDIRGIVNLEGDTSGEAHRVVKGAAGSPLRQALLAGEGEGYGSEDTKQRSKYERGVGGEHAGSEAGFGDDKRQHVEGDGEGSIADDEVDEVDEERHGSVRVRPFGERGERESRVDSARRLGSRRIVGWREPKGGMGERGKGKKRRERIAEFRGVCEALVDERLI